MQPKYSLIMLKGLEGRYACRVCERGALWQLTPTQSIKEDNWINMPKVGLV